MDKFLNKNIENKFIKDLMIINIMRKIIFKNVIDYCKKQIKPNKNTLGRWNIKDDKQTTYYMNNIHADPGYISVNYFYRKNTIKR